MVEYTLNVATDTGLISCTDCSVSNKPSDAPKCFNCGAEILETDA